MRRKVTLDGSYAVKQMNYLLYPYYSGSTVSHTSPIPGDRIDSLEDLSFPSADPSSPLLLPLASGLNESYFFITTECNIEYSDSWYFLQEFDFKILLTKAPSAKFVLIASSNDCSNYNHSLAGIQNQIKNLHLQIQKHIYILKDPIIFPSDSNIDHSNSNSNMNILSNWLLSWSIHKRPTLEILPSIKSTYSNINSNHNINFDKFHIIDATGTDKWAQNILLDNNNNNNNSFSCPNNMTGVCGKIQYVGDGCTSTSIPKTNQTNLIALVYRGTCTFTTKAINIQNSGYIALIIINTNGIKITMSGNDNNHHIKIPVIMIDSKPGNMLEEYILFHNSNEIYVRLFYRNSIVPIATMDQLGIVHEIGSSWSDITDLCLHGWDHSCPEWDKVLTLHACVTETSTSTSTQQCSTNTDIEQLWYGDDGLNSNYNHRQKHFTVPIPNYATQIQLTSYITGHGWGVEMEDCAEFCRSSHHFRFHSTSKNHSFEVSKSFLIAGTDRGCVDQISSGVSANQYGTWYLGRAGWCPGQVLPLHTWNMTIHHESSTSSHRYISYANGDGDGDARQFQIPLDEDGDGDGSSGGNSIIISSYALVDGKEYVPVSSGVNEGFSAQVFRSVWLVVSAQPPTTPPMCTAHQLPSRRVQVHWNETDATTTGDSGDGDDSPKYWTVVRMYLCAYFRGCVLYEERQYNYDQNNYTDSSTIFSYNHSHPKSVISVSFEIYLVNAVGASSPCVIKLNISEEVSILSYDIHNDGKEYLETIVPIVVVCFVITNILVFVFIRNLWRERSTPAFSALEDSGDGRSREPSAAATSAAVATTENPMNTFTDHREQDNMPTHVDSRFVRLGTSDADNEDALPAQRDITTGENAACSGDGDDTLEVVLQSVLGPLKIQNAAFAMPTVALFYSFCLLLCLLDVRLMRSSSTLLCYFSSIGPVVLNHHVVNQLWQQEKRVVVYNQKPTLYDIGGSCVEWKDVVDLRLVSRSKVWLDNRVNRFGMWYGMSSTRLVSPLGEGVGAFWLSRGDIPQICAGDDWLGDLGLGEEASEYRVAFVDCTWGVDARISIKGLCEVVNVPCWDGRGDGVLNKWNILHYIRSLSFWSIGVKGLGCRRSWTEHQVAVLKDRVLGLNEVEDERVVAEDLGDRKESFVATD
eukprot:gene1939-3759_t